MENRVCKNLYSKERYKWLKKNRICARCGCEEAEPNNIYCLECIEKDRAKSAEWYKRNRDRCKTKMREYSKKLYYERKEKGICTKCGKRKVCRKSTVRCIDCYIKRNRWEKARRGNLISRSERPAYGFCYQCGKHELYSDKLCKECFERCSNTAKRIQQNPTAAMLDARENYKNYFKVIFSHS